MNKPALVILAAGMGSRYGGLKQIDPVDDYGNLIIDYSVHDALKAGFSDVVCIIKKSIEKDFLEVFGDRISSHANLRLAYQELDTLPKGYVMPAGREKPWGTAHALMCARDVVDGPFTIINADDYYGPSAFRDIYDYLIEPRNEGEFSMMAYNVENTLTDNGTVTRGVCRRSPGGYLQHIDEISGIKRDPGGAIYDNEGYPVKIPAGTPVSMNFWGFDTSIFDMLEDGFNAFLDEKLNDHPLKCEYLLPVRVDELIKSGRASVKMLQSHDEWFGVTYKEDRAAVMQIIKSLKEKGLYSETLWK